MRIVRSLSFYCRGYKERFNEHEYVLFIQINSFKCSCFKTAYIWWPLSKGSITSGYLWTFAILCFKYDEFYSLIKFKWCDDEEHFIFTYISLSLLIPIMSMFWNIYGSYSMHIIHNLNVHELQLMKTITEYLKRWRGVIAYHMNSFIFQQNHEVRRPFIWLVSFHS